MSPKQLIICFLFFASFVVSKAGTSYTWTGLGINNSWATQGNWSPTGVPGTDPTDHVTIGQVTGLAPRLDMNRTIGNLVFSLQSLDLGGFTLTVNGPVSQLGSGIIKNGSLVLNPSATLGQDLLALSANSNYLTIQTTSIATPFTYSLTGAVPEPSSFVGGTSGGGLHYAPVTLPSSGTAFVNMAVTNPSVPTQSVTLQLSLNPSNQVTAVNVVDAGQSYVLPVSYYTLYNNKSHISFGTSLLSLLFPVCAPSVGTENQNFVRTQIAQVECKDAALLNNLPVESVVQGTVYFDGLGRPIEKIIKQFSPNKRDIVKLIDYDNKVNTIKNYLPYASNTCSGAYVEYPTALAQQQNFYTVNNDPLIPKVVDPSQYNGSQNNAYSLTVYDGSALNRVVEQYAPGNAWKINLDQFGFYPDKTNPGKAKRQVLRTNNANEVLLWSFDHATGNATAAVSNAAVYYAAGTLMVSEISDEDGGQIVQYMDVEGKLLLKKEKKDASTYQSTYYVYDDFGRLVYIVSPEATSRLSTQNWSLTPIGTFTKTWLFRYTYDARHRLTSKQIPGADPEYIVYDKLDRPVMTQDGNQAQKSPTKEWKFTKYDIVGRPVYSGNYLDNSAPTALQTAFDGATTVYEKKGSGAGYVDGYSTLTFPTSIATGNLESVNYYDDYDFDANASPDYQYGNAGLGAQEPTGIQLKPRGYPTGMKIKNLDGASNPWLITAVFYDGRDRVVQAQSNNHLYMVQNPTLTTTLADITTIVYDFAGKVLRTKQVHTPGVVAATTVSKQFAYDHVGRLKSIDQQNNTATAVNLARYNYNELGKPVEKNLHSENSGSTFLQSVDYRHNIRGWLTSINNSGLSNDGLTNNDANDLFGMNLVYEADFNGLNTPKFNGSITAARWRTNNASMNFSGTERAYTYKYDLANQLTGAEYAENTGSGWTTTNKYKESNIAYDLNGNITALTRTNGTGTTIDNLVYTYSGNQITKMVDQGVATGGFVSKSSAEVQYTYDRNGNVLIDLNKEVTLTYNYYNQIRTVTGTGGKAGKSIAYTYDAGGRKLKKSVTGNGVTTVTHYVNNFVYEYSNGTYKLQFFGTEEGRVVPNASNTGFEYQYTISDHLGSARVTFGKGTDGKAEVIQEDHYYAFGLRMEGLSFTKSSPKNSFLYGKNEAEDDFNLLNQYDYGFRQYDPALGRWHSPDLLSDLYHSYSPYAYAMNNPVNLMDFMGLAAGDLKDTETIKGGGDCPDGSDAKKKSDGSSKAASDKKKQDEKREEKKQQEQKKQEEVKKQSSGGEKKEPTPDPTMSKDNTAGVMTSGGSQGGDNRSATMAPPITITWQPWRINLPTIAPALSMSLLGSVAAILVLTSSDTRKDKEEYITLYRGVHAGHPDYTNAMKGMAVPAGGDASSESHNGGNYKSNFTSWSMSRSVANYHANKKGAGGIVLIKRFKSSQVLPSDDIYHELEMLVPGVVKGATVTEPSGPGTPTAY